MPTTVSPTAAEHLLGRTDSDLPALVTSTATVSHGELADRARQRAADLALPGRSVVVLTGPPTTEMVVTYLALLSEGHVPLLAGDHAERLAAAWRPAAVVTVTDDVVDVDRRTARPLDLHPDLALLLSTSGSTGSPKLVRLSHDNVVSNARSIAASLGLTAADRAITSLPLHYCYGLSVLHSHLVAGASIVLTGAGVVDPCFAAAMRDHRVTTLAGVPHTFALLERADPERVHVPSLRLLTQAGGRMPPETVLRWHRRARAWGADLFVMYGQTEATARMACLPPELVERRPGAVGHAVPGGSFEIRPADADLRGEASAADGDRARDRDEGEGAGAGREAAGPAGSVVPVGSVGEVVYHGPNVMLGYASDPADLALGRTVHELRTGDLGRIDPELGVLEIVGRASRFVKPYGLRIDLDALEDRLRPDLGEVSATGDDERLVVAAPAADPATAPDLVHAATGLPAATVAVLAAGDLPGGGIPRTAAGKVDHPRLRALAAGPEPTSAPDLPPAGADEAGTATVGDVYAAVLGRSAVDPAATFVTAGGDSLSYVECSIRLERLLGHLPDDWHTRTVAELDALDRRAHRSRVDATVVLRAVGICAVVATHMRLLYFPGGAHLLLAVAGYNLSRFQLSLDRTGDRLRAGLRTVGRVAVPTVAWTAVALVVSDSYGPTTLGLVNNYLGPRSHDGDHWHFWFIEAFVQLVLLATLLLAVPAVRRVERRFPYGFPLLLLVGALALRDITWAGLDDPANLRFRTHGIAFFLVLGWLAHRSRTWQLRVATTLLCVATIPGFFGRTEREWFVIVGIVALAWWGRVAFPRRLVPVTGALAAASMWILISHFSIWPPLDRMLPRPAAYVATLVAGIAVWALAEHGPRVVRDAASRRGGPRSEVVPVAR